MDDVPSLSARAPEGAQAVASGGPRAGKLGVLQLVGVIFMAVAGGPYGFEDAVGAAGLRKTLMFLVLLPLVWSAPLALMTAELSCLMPENGGHVVWIDRAFGKFLGSLNATSG